MTPEAFGEAAGVSRETVDRLSVYADLLRRWQARINLVGRTTLDDLWHRHFLDSAQLLDLLPTRTGRVVDLGSGAGFPGLVLSILGVDDVHLIEHDARKAAFLREAVRLTGASAQVHATDIERVRLDPKADIVTARALAPLATLVDLARPLAARRAIGLFLKGRTAEQESTTLLAGMSADLVPSRTDSGSFIVRVRGLSDA